MAWLLVAALGVLLAVVGLRAVLAEPSTPPAQSGALDLAALPGAIPLVGAPIPAPAADESATGGPSTGELTFTDPAPATGVAPAQVPVGPSGIPGLPMAAYRRAEQALAVSTPGCRLGWPLLAAIGRAESGHAGGGRLDASGRTVGQILGPRLDGSPGLARVADSDGGQWDGDPNWDRAVGPMQFVPPVWRRYATDANGDGRTDPNDVFDAALTAGRYLCAGGTDLADPGHRSAAVFRYHRSAGYVSTVLGWSDAYRAGAPTVPAVPALPAAQAPSAALTPPVPSARPVTPAPPATTRALPPARPPAPPVRRRPAPTPVLKAPPPSSKVALAPRPAAAAVPTAPSQAPVVIVLRPDEPTQCAPAPIDESTDPSAAPAPAEGEAACLPPGPSG